MTRAGFTLAALAGCCVAGCSAGPLEVATLMPQNLLDGLVAHWAFDEGVGTVADDSSGNARTGAIAGPGWSWLPNGQFGSALHFSGVDYVSVGAFPRATASYTVAAWVLVQVSELGAPIANLISTEMIGGGWSLYGSLSVPPGTYSFRYEDNAVTADYAQATCDVADGSICLDPGVWTHLAAVVDAGSLTLYVNGVVSTVSSTMGPILPGSGTLYLGRSAELTPTFPLTGALDDVAIWSRALVPAEIQELVAAAVPAPM